MLILSKKHEVVSFIALCVACTGAHAYIDPASGNFLLQTLVAGAVGALATTKLWFNSIWIFIRNIFNNKNTTELSEQQEIKDDADKKNNCKQ